MRILRIVVIPLILITLGACASPAATLVPAPTTPAPSPTTPTPSPTTPTPAPTTPAPAPTTPTPAPAPDVQGANEIWIVGTEFRPFIITVSVGTKVTWLSKDRGELHTITSNTGLFDGALYYGQSFSYTFTENGTFSYYCIPHSGMAGTVFVK